MIMALDGIVIRALADELDSVLHNARVQRIIQPEPEELLIHFGTVSGTVKVLFSANASLPLLYITDENKTAPQSAPNFCMLLRKLLGSARVISVSQPGLERVVDVTFEHLDEFGDVRKKHLITELMGKYSNIILTNDAGLILDAIRHVNASVSSVRTVLPGKDYFIPKTQDKRSITDEDPELFLSLLQQNDTLQDALFQHYTGFSYQAVSEFLFENRFEPDRYVSDLTDIEKARFAEALFAYVSDIESGRFRLCAAYENGTPVSFNAMGLPSYETNPELYRTVSFESPSALLFTYYSERNAATNMKQRSADLRKSAANLLERAVKKEALQKKQMKDADKRETLRLYGELLNAYSYTLPVGEKAVTVLNYYDNTELSIPVDPDLSIKDNAKKYFDRYSKLKRTAEALTQQLQDTEAEIRHLSSIVQSIDMAQDQDTLRQIREEMENSGYLKKQNEKGRMKNPAKSRPYRYRSSDGFDIYVGKNNLQNDELTFHFASSDDLWFHAKQMPGSHVILKTDGRSVPDRAYEEAASLAAYYSTGRANAKCDVDYVLKKEVKKPSGAKPGFVVYYTNYSMTVRPGTDGLTLIE